MTAANGDVAVAAEAECLELADDFERERVVEFEHVHIVGADSRVAECTLGRASSDDAVDVPAVTTAPAGEIPGRGVLIRRTVEVRAAAQHVNRSTYRLPFV